MPTVWLCPSAFAPHVGGIEEATRRLALEMQRRGIEVTVVTHRHPAELPAVETVDGLPVRRIDFPSPTASVRGTLTALGRLATTLRALRSLSRRPDVVHVHGASVQLPVLTLYCALRRVPLVVATHGEVTADDHRIFEHSVYLRAALRWASRRAAALVAVSEPARAGAAGVAPAFRSASVVPGGVVVEEWSVTPPPPAPVFCAWGRQEHVKGFDVLLEAFRDVRLTHPDAVLLLGGDGSVTDELHRIAGAGVQFLGRLDRAGVGAMLARSRVAVVPSRAEAFGLVALEAMAAGRAVVWSELDGIRSATGGRGVPATPGDPVSLADAMRRSLAAVPDPAAERAQAARFTWTAAVDRYLALTPRVLAGHVG